MVIFLPLSPRCAGRLSCPFCRGADGLERLDVEVRFVGNTGMIPSYKQRFPWPWGYPKQMVYVCLCYGKSHLQMDDDLGVPGTPIDGTPKSSSQQRHFLSTSKMNKHCKIVRQIAHGFHSEYVKKIRVWICLKIAYWPANPMHSNINTIILTFLNFWTRHWF